MLREEAKYLASEGELRRRPVAPLRGVQVPSVVVELRVRLVQVVEEEVRRWLMPMVGCWCSRMLMGGVCGSLGMLERL